MPLLFGKIGDEVGILFERLFEVLVFELFAVGGRGATRLFLKLFAEVLRRLIAHLAIKFGKRDIRPFDEFFCLDDA